MTESIAKRWRLLSGHKNWENLLEPLDIDLRKYIIHYGEMAQATYDAFDSERASKFAGDSRYSMKTLFSKVGLTKANPFKYEPTKFFYATSQVPMPAAFILKSFSREAWNEESNWMGYVAVATDEGKVVLGRRDIVIAWRGTIQAFEWINDFDFPAVSGSEIFGEATDPEAEPQVCSAWLSIYTSDDPRSPYNKTSAREQVLQEVMRLIEEYKDEEISITVVGHSLGAALGTLNAADIVANGLNKIEENPEKACPVTAFVFASPRVGDSNFKELLLSMKDLRILHVRNSPDLAPYYPLMDPYSDVGTELLINTLKSKYLKSPGDVGIWHCLEVYLHGVAGTHGKDGRFDLEVKRDIALVNKRRGALEFEYLVPSSWWCIKNKGMVQCDDGFWKQVDRKEDDTDQL